MPLCAQHRVQTPRIGEERTVDRWEYLYRKGIRLRSGCVIRSVPETGRWSGVDQGTLGSHRFTRLEMALRGDDHWVFEVT
ncbi:hypothetical protein BO71DRAFT_148291 [Aspergillus ellipticus CBS 707.79]|uniref:Uncharacterized protein n=1 Tax=Aspergillus ellipticus CBS 707.79 TaxID=1448320 RepID=A0A319D0N1_9EURO|nr:hypothetical protein BO71DRAFT_148291 [Aspergillus ellipticus CBS 707.79]